MLSVRDVQEQQTLITQWWQKLDALHARIAGRFVRAEVRERVRHYLRGVVSHVARKNGWQLAEQVGEVGPQGIQRLLNRAIWSVAGVRDDLRAYVMEHLGDPQGVLVIDETGFLKNGLHSVAVQRQYSGTAGRIENCQIGVFLAYASCKGRALVDRELYLPQGWANDVARRTKAGVPPEVTFATKPELAQQMLARAFAAHVPAAWVTGDEVYGNSGALRGWLEQAQHPYVLAVSATHPIWHEGQVARATALVSVLPASAWSLLSAGEGSQGPRLYQWATLPIPYPQPSGMSSWLLVRRSMTDPTELAYFRAFGAAATALSELVQVAGRRWSIEECFKLAKGLVGMDHYEVRQWRAWYCYVTLALLAYAYLAVTCAQTSLPTGEQKAALLIPLSVPELRRLLLLAATPIEDVAFHLGWSLWRRQHQARAQHSHHKRRACRRQMGQGLALPISASARPPAALSDDQWACLQPWLPPQKPPTGRPPLDHRPMVDGMLWVQHHGLAWRALPTHFGPWQTVYSRYRRWRQGGIWHKILQLLHPP